MDELKFVLRCFGFAALLLLLTQIKTGNATIEHRIEGSLMNSRTADFVNKVADGGVKLIRDSMVLAQATYADWKKPVAETREDKTSVMQDAVAKVKVMKDEITQMQQAQKEQPGSDEETELTEENY